MSKRNNSLKYSLIIGAIILVISAIIVYASSKKPEVALIAVANPACTYQFSIKQPSPIPSPSPSPSPTPSICVITTTPPDHSTVCLKEPGKISLKVHVNSLPNNPPYHLISFWQLVAPTVGAVHNLSNIPNIQVGQTYTLTADWPGIPTGSRDTIDVMIGYNVKEGDINNGRLLGGACSKGFNYYWTPWVTCP